jgi:D-3-phosphoglycerate dehydrogenase
MQRTGIFVTDKLAEEAKTILSNYDIYELEASDEILAKCSVLIAWPTKTKGLVLSKMKSLRLVQSLSAGVDALDFSLIPLDVVVCSNAGAYTDSVAEHAWGLLLGLAKGLHARKQRIVPRMLKGRTLLVVGCGAIGSEVARLSRSLEMKTVGVSRSFRHPEYFDERHGLEGLESAIGLADAVVITLPLTAETRGAIGYKVLSKANDHVCIVNVGRGGVVKKDGLLSWLRERPESRYATDVFWKKDGGESFETVAWDLPNFGGTLHIAGVPLGDRLVSPMVEAARNVKRYLETGEANNRVDRSEYAGHFSRPAP